MTKIEKGKLLEELHFKQYEFGHEYYDGTGCLHSITKPASEFLIKTYDTRFGEELIIAKERRWYKNGVIHRDEVYKEYGKTKRRPAIIIDMFTFTENEYGKITLGHILCTKEKHYVKGLKHNEYGPADLYTDYTSEHRNFYFLKGVAMTEEEWKVAVTPKEMTLKEVSEKLGYPVKIIEEEQQ